MGNLAPKEAPWLDPHPLKQCWIARYINFVVQTVIVKYIRKPLKGIPINYKRIKGKEYAFQVVRAWRDPTTGRVRKEERYLGARKPARQKPIMDGLDKTDIDIITTAWQRGEDVAWIQLYVKTVAHDEPSPATVYNWFRAQGIKRGKRTTKRAEKKTTAETARVERIRRIKLEEKERKARQAKRRIAARKEIERGKK